MNTDELVLHFVQSVIVCHALEYIKNSRYFPWLTCQSDRLNRIVAFVIAIVSGIGVTWNIAAAANGGNTIMITVPSWHEITAAVYHIALQGGFQQMYYKNVITKKVKIDPLPATHTINIENPVIVKPQ